MAAFWIVVVEGAAPVRELEVVGTRIVGRDQASDLTIDDPEASRQHAAITAADEAVVIEDLGSTNGTSVNDERLEEKRPLREGDRVRIGTTVLELRTTPGAPSSAAGEEPSEPETAPAASPEPAEEPPTAPDDSEPKPTASWWRRAFGRSRQQGPEE